jgi:hypothetical protein
VLEEHHINGYANDASSTVILCRNHHAIVEEYQREEGASFAVPSTILDRDFSVKRHQAALLRAIADMLASDATRLAALYLALDREYPDWRKLPEAAP